MAFIIAEVGSNFRDLTDCLTSISMAKACGADAVKFQLFTSEALYGLPGKIDQKYCLPLEWLPKLKEKADACGIEFMCTAFSPDLLGQVYPFVKRHKIASSDLNYSELLMTARYADKPIILSMGGAPAPELQRTLDFFRKHPALKPFEHGLTLLYCVSAYPARTIDLGNIPLLKARYNIPVGFSDHSTDIYGHPVMACRDYGATMLEKHFTVIPEVDTPDRPHSLNVDEFRRMVTAIRDKSPIHPTFEENAMTLRHRRRIIAIRDIKEGDILISNRNFGLYRALHDDSDGLGPHHVYYVHGKKAAGNIAAGTPIGPRMVDGISGPQ